MKNKFWKKSVSLLSAVAIAGTMLTGCGAADSKENKSAESKSEESSEDALELKVTTIYFGDTTPAGSVIQTAWEEMMEEKMGKKLDITWEYIHQGDYSEKFQVITGGGDLPDIMTVFGASKADIDKYGEQGLYADLSQYKELMPNYMKYAEQDPEFERNAYSPKGNLYGFFNLSLAPTGTAHTASVMAVKNSVLKENGLGIPTTLDEVYEVAKALKEKGVSEYPIILHEEWQNPESTVFNAYHTSSRRFWNGSEFEYGPVSDDYKLALEYLNKIYTEGLIAPDYFTNTVEQGNASLANGSACIILSAWEGYPAQWATERADEEWVGVPLPTSDKYADNPWWFLRELKNEVTLNTAFSVVINSQSKVLEDAIKFMDYQYDEDVINLLNWGIEGETYEVVDGKKKFLLAGAENLEKINELGLPVGCSKRSGIFPQPQDMDLWRIENQDNNPIYWEGEIVSDKLVSFCTEHMNESNTHPADEEPTVTLSVEENSTYSEIMTPVETYMKEQKAKFIKGERSFDEWDAYIEEINKMGDIQKAMDLYNSKIK